MAKSELEIVGQQNSIRSAARALEAAAGLCLSRTNYNVEIEHWLIKLLEPAEGDLARLLKHYDVDTTKVVRELTHSLGRPAYRKTPALPNCRWNCSTSCAKPGFLAGTGVQCRPAFRSGYVPGSIVDRAST